ncbi:Na+/H+ antiporter NhaC family protein [Thermotalea metallivorans]|uniref:Malate-2H(+)/Na(+)-lactate antiporter n=1 Tax=Thermotalea metallivorans TaxID=520762 RepID=A0A140L7R1_9FIRM|nr:Na+/H+ antiporter NhaC family protein [Thermotalea metallivorans]KXG76586.1 Malate-2H(+)/Na(+)-lactate antiporter [Thermotalea metallivorans]
MKKTIGMPWTYGTLFVMLFSILLSIQLGYSAYYGLMISIIFIGAVVHSHGYTPKEIANMLGKGIKSAWIVLVVMALIGILIGLWMMGGTIPTMMYLGFRYLSDLNFILAAFLITSMVSMVLGTSLGTMGTVGMALVGIGKGLSIPLPLLVGAIVSGGYFGDRSSPMSSSANLTAVVTETKLPDNLRHMAATITPVFILCTIFYAIAGRFYAVHGPNPEIMELQHMLATYFPIHWMMLIPPLMIMVMAIFRFPMLHSLIVGLLASLGIILFQQQFSFSQILEAALLGFQHPIPEVSAILSGGGLLSMKNVILIIASSTALNGILDGTRMIEPLIHKFIAKTKNSGDLILRTSFLSFIIAVITCNQTLAVIIPGKFLQKVFREHQISLNTLARTIADSGIVLVPLIPWNVNGVIITAMFGISISAFAPYALLTYLTPLCTLAFGYMGLVKKDCVNVSL